MDNEQGQEQQLAASGFRCLALRLVSFAFEAFIGALRVRFGGWHFGSALWCLALRVLVAAVFERFALRQQQDRNGHCMKC